MASGASKRRIQKSLAPQELNLIPIMNLFITIIPMLLVIIVSVNLALLSLSLSPGDSVNGGSGEGEGSADQQVKKIELIIHTDKFEIREEGRDNRLISKVEDNIGALRYDYFALDSVLEEIKSRNEDVREIRVTPYPDVQYGTLIRAIDISKTHGFPDVKYERLRMGMM